MTKWKPLFFVFWPMILCATLVGCVGDDSPSDPKYTITADVNQIEWFNQVGVLEDEERQAVAVDFAGPGLLVGFAPTANPVPWLQFEIIELNETTAQVDIVLVNGNQINPGIYDTTIRLSTGDSTSNFFVHHDIQVSLRVWQFAAFGEPSFGAVLGTTEFESQPIELLGESSEWTATPSDDWITLDATSGSGPAVINVTPDVTSLTAAGTYTGSVVIFDSISNETFTQPVELALDNVRLFANDVSVTLTDLPHIQQLQQTVSVFANSDAIPLWEAASEETWLTLTADTALNELTILADSSSLAEGTTSGTITFSTSDGSALATTIAVSVYKQTTDATDITIEATTSNDSAIVTHPTQPLVYVGVGTSIIAFNTYTGDEIVRFDDLIEEVTNLIISSDGGLLFANATTTEVIPPAEEGGEETTVEHQQLVRINLADNTVSTIELEEDINFTPDRFVTVSGQGLLTNRLFEFFDIDTGLRLEWQPIVDDADDIQVMQGVVQASSTGAFFSTTTAGLYKSEAYYNAYKEQPLEFTEVLTDVYTDSALNNIAIRANESEIIANGEANESILFDGAIFTPNGLLTDNDTLIFIDLDITEAEQALFLRFEPGLGFKIYRHDTDNSLISEDLIGAITSTTGFTLTGDEQRIVMQKPATLDAEGNVTTEGDIIIANSAPLKSALPFVGVYQDADLGEQELAVMGTARSWIVETKDDWLAVDQTSGTGEATLTVSVDTSLVNVSGLLDSAIYLTNTATNRRTTYPVQVALDSQRLFASDQAVALSDTAHGQQLSQSINVLTNGESLVSWNASSASAWLTLTPGTNGELTITANPASLAEGLHETTVTISPANATDAVGSDIAVSLYKRTAAAVDVELTSIAANTRGTVADPLRPYIYLASGTSIVAYDAYTGTEVSRVDGLVSDVTTLMVADDGSYLYGNAVETIDGEDTDQLIKVDLSDFSVEQIALDTTLATTPQFFVRVSGKPMLANGILQYIDINDGSLVGTNQLEGQQIRQISQSKGTGAIFASSADSIHELTTMFNAVAEDDAITTSIKNSLVFSDSSLNGLFVSSDDDKLYSAGSDNEAFGYDGTTFSELGKLPDTGETFITLVMDETNEPLLLKADLTVPAMKFYRYNSDGTLKSELTTNLPLAGATMVLTGDTQRAAVTSGTSLWLINTK